jgi:predicted urease superfamily metal-dependent hydrolase
MIDAGFYQSPSQFLDQMIMEKALLCLPCVKEDVIKQAEEKVLQLRRVATEFDRIEQEKIAQKERIAKVWNEIVLAFKKIYKAPDQYATSREIAQIRIQSSNWLESRYLDDPETRNALFEMFGGPVDKTRLFELLVDAIANNPNFEQ